MARLALMTLVLAACSGDPTGPPSGAAGPGMGTGTGGTPASSALTGSWRTVVVIQVPGDLQTWTTTWQFDAEGTCRQTIVTESLAEGFPRTTDRACTWSADGRTVTVSYVGGGTLAFPYSFAGLSPDRLVLDGYEYQRTS